MRKKRLTNNIKVKRLQWQIESIKKSLAKCKDKGAITQLKLAIDKRDVAIKFLESSKENLTWREITKRFGFSYHDYYTNSEKYYRKKSREGYTS